MKEIKTYRVYEITKFNRKPFLNEIEKEFGKYLIEKDDKNHKRVEFSRNKRIYNAYNPWLLLTFDTSKNIKHLKRIDITKKCQKIFNKFKPNCYEYLNVLLNLCL